jgi:tetratricopeptide (TPR) repeat protein
LLTSVSADHDRENDGQGGDDDCPAAAENCELLVNGDACGVSNRPAEGPDGRQGRGPGEGDPAGVAAERDRLCRADRQPAYRAQAAGNLPRLLSPLIGRAADLEALASQVEQNALVTLTGPAGVGKTRLAIELARRVHVPGGGWLIRLDAADHKTDLTQAVAETMHVHDERSNIDSALAWCARHDPLLGVRIANGFGWTWVVLGDGIAGAHRVRSALEAAALQVGARDRVTSRLLAGWLEASAGNVARAEDDLDRALGEATTLNDALLRADAQRHLAFLRLQQARPHDAVELSHESAAVYQSRNQAWERAASLLLGAAGSMMLGEIVNAAAAADEAVRLLTPIGDAWGLVHAEAMLGAIAQADHRFDDASRYLENAAASSERLGFLGQAAYHLTRLGRVQHQAGQLPAARQTLTRAVQAAIRGSDPRMAATARVNLARIMRATEQNDAAQALLHQCDDWYRTAGGGDGALLTRALLAATSEADDPELESIIDQARLAGEHEVQVIILDALALRAAQRGQLRTAQQLLATADAAALAAVNIADEVDRLDAHRARELIRPVAAGRPHTKDSNRSRSRK